MFARKTILALATFATLGTAALAPTSASAWGHGGGHWGGWGWGHRWGGWGWGGWHGRYCAWHRCGVAYPVAYYGGAYAVPTGGSAPTSVYSGAPSGPPRPGRGCLAKGYTPDGGVVCTDRCTQEGAVATAEPPQEGPPKGSPSPRR